MPIFVFYSLTGLNQYLEVLDANLLGSNLSLHCNIMNVFVYFSCWICFTVLPFFTDIPYTKEIYDKVFEAIPLDAKYKVKILKDNGEDYDVQIPEVTEKLTKFGII